MQLHVEVSRATQACPQMYHSSLRWSEAMLQDTQGLGATGTDIQSSETSQARVLQPETSEFLS